MGGFVDCYRFFMGWWSGQTAVPQGATVYATFLYTPQSGMTYVAETGGFTFDVGAN